MGQQEVGARQGCPRSRLALCQAQKALNNQWECQETQLSSCCCSPWVASGPIAGAVSTAQKPKRHQSLRPHRQALPHFPCPGNLPFQRSSVWVGAGAALALIHFSIRSISALQGLTWLRHLVQGKNGHN